MPLFKIREQIISRYPEAEANAVCDDLHELLNKIVKEGVLEPA